MTHPQEPDTLAQVTANELRGQLAALGLSQAAFARLIDRDPVTVNRYCHDRLAVPQEVALIVALLTALTPRRRAAVLDQFNPD